MHRLIQLPRVCRLVKSEVETFVQLMAPSLKNVEKSQWILLCVCAVVGGVTPLRYWLPRCVSDATPQTLLTLAAGICLLGRSGCSANSHVC